MIVSLDNDEDSPRTFPDLHGSLIQNLHGLSSWNFSGFDIG
jgi:hypothetical protein